MKINFTEDQIKKNREFVDKEISRVSKISKDSNLFFVCLIHWAPLSNCLESRVAFFEDNYDAYLWKDMMNNTYSKLDILYEIYSI